MEQELNTFFKSYHFGIETQLQVTKAIRIEPLNRTILELKRHFG